MKKFFNTFATTIILVLATCFTPCTTTAQTFPTAGMSGNGSETNPYQIETHQHLKALADFVNAGNGSETAGRFYKLMNHINLSSYDNWEPIGMGITSYANLFQGHFIGNGKLITNLTINRPAQENVGLFGGLANASVEHLGIENCNIVGQRVVGSIAGFLSESLIANCYASGNVSSTQIVGGLTGSAEGASLITNSYSACDVTAENIAGGLAGHLETQSTISYSYATGNVSVTGTGTQIVAGGLVGSNSDVASIVNCFAANISVKATSTSTSSYINRIVGQDYDGGVYHNNYALNTMVVQNSSGVITITDGTTFSGIGKTLSELQSEAFFSTASNWHGSAWNLFSAWKINDGVEFPLLQWQKKQGAAITKPEATDITETSITIGTLSYVDVNTGQLVQTAISTTNTANAEDLTWLSTPTFTDLSPNTTYYVYARSAENADFYVGTPSVSDAITTLEAPTIHDCELCEDEGCDVCNPPTYDCDMCEDKGCSVCTPIYGISLSESGTYTFPNRTFGYSHNPDRPVTVTNTGNLPTGELFITLTGTNSHSFEINKNNFVNIAPGGTDNFTVFPIIGLNAGTYTATVNVWGSGYIEQKSFSVSFTVDKAAGASVSAPTINSVTHNSVTINPVTSPSNGQTVEYAISTEHYPAYEMTWQTDLLFTELLPNTLYYIYARSAENANYLAGNRQYANFWTLATPTYSISLSQSGTYTFPAATFGYGTQTVLTVWVINTGNQNTGNLSYDLTGADAESFDIFNVTYTIPVGQQRGFEVAPKTGLAVGTHTAIITVSNENVDAQSFNVSFTVNPILCDFCGEINCVCVHDTIRLTWKTESTGIHRSFRTIIPTGKRIMVDFGDGTSPMTYNSNNSGGTLDVQGIGKNYSNAGTYNVTIWTETPDWNITHFETTGWPSQQISALDVSKAPLLEHLECPNNQLTSLNLSANTALETLVLYYNQLTSLPSLTALTSLKDLNLNENQLTSINVSNNTALEYLHLWGNELTTIDVSNNTALKILDVAVNQLTSLISSPSLTSLEELFIRDNQLTSIDVSIYPALVHLSCADNQLTELNVTNNPALEHLGCRGNLLTSLNVSQNPALRILNCSDNLLTGINVSQNTALTDFICGGNLFTSVDVSANTELRYLGVWNLQLTSLNVSSNTKLQTLYCNENFLTTLDLSANTLLRTLYCWNNLLTNLNLSANTVLQSLECQNNQLSALDLSANTQLRTFSGNGNRLTSLVFGTTLLNLLSTYDNQLQLSDLYSAFLRVANPTTNVNNRRFGTQTLTPQILNLNETANFSSSAILGTTATTFAVTKNGSTAVIGTDYSISNGVITFLSLGDFVVTMTNAALLSNPDFPAKVVADFTVIIAGSFVAVTDISGIPTTATARTPLTLNGIIAPSDATDKNIVWSVRYQGTAGATISNGNRLNTTNAGTVTITATVMNGTAIGTPFTKDFVITVNSSIIPVTSITGIPTEAVVNVPLSLNPTITPSNATNKHIIWTVKSTGTTGATIIGGNAFRATAAGTAIINALIIEGITEDVNFSQDFTITVTDPSSSIAGVNHDSPVIIYPNPVQTEFTVSGFEIRGSGYGVRGNPLVEIFDMSGKRVLVKHLAPSTSHPATVNVSHLPKGTYFLRIGTQTTKIIKY